MLKKKGFIYTKCTYLAVLSHVKLSSWNLFQKTTYSSFTDITTHRSNWFRFRSPDTVMVPDSELWSAIQKQWHGEVVLSTK